MVWTGASGRPVGMAGLPLEAAVVWLLVAIVAVEMRGWSEALAHA
jgi:hypothetical protein